MNELESHEPTAEVRAAANNLAQMYVALIQEGFNTGQAMYLLGQSLRGAIAAGGDNPASE